MAVLSTAKKIMLARWGSRGVTTLRTLMGLGSELKAMRSGFLWDLDLTEGIDFSIWLLGGFEPNTLKQYEQLVKLGSTVLDIGANIGAHTLPLARLVGPAGRVLAFEPTRWAYDKLRRNLALNPALTGRVDCFQTLLVAEQGESLPSEIYSSWPLSDQQEGLHDQHKGRLMTTAGASVSTLDNALEGLRVENIDFIKLDVDGNEYAVICGALHTLKTHRPTLLMELAPYVFDKRPGEFDALIRLLLEIGYMPQHPVSRRILPIEPDQLRRTIPDGGSINALFVPI